MFSGLKKTVHSIFNDLTKEENNNKAILIFFSKTTSFFAFFYGIASFLHFKNFTGIIVCFIVSGVCWMVVKLIHLDFNYRFIVHLLVFSGFIGIYYNAYLHGGINSTIAAWSVFLPLIPLLILNIKDALGWLGIIQLTNFLLWYFGNVQPLYNGEKMNPLFNLLVIEGLNIMIFLFSYFFYYSRDKTAAILREKNMELEITKSNLIESQNHKDIFIANISHELRNPLGIIIGLISIAEKTETDQKLKMYLSESINAARHLLSIINDLLDISNLESGRISIIKNNFNLHKLITSTTIYFDNKVQQKNIEYIVKIHPDTPLIMYNDSIRITQIVNNLIDNSIKYTESGQIHMNCKIADKNIEISVTDSGIGIPEDKIDCIFDNFYRVNYDNSISGTGLGLSIVKEIVGKLDGTISAQSILNVGTTITVTLPYAINETEELINSELEFINIRKELSNIKILVAEDMLLNNVILEHILNEYIENSCIDFVNDGNGVLEIIGSKDFDVILMDINMPNKNGIETTKEIRALYGNKHKIIALTANALKKDIDSSKIYGVNEYATKPIQAHDLIRKIHRVLQ